MNRLLTITATAALLLAGAPARAADPQPYSVAIAPTGSDTLDSTLQATAQLVTLKDKVPIPPFALIERARSDVPRIQTALDSFGYYLNKVDITIGGHALTDPDLPGYLDSLPQNTPAAVNVAIDKGPLYRLGDVEVDGTLPDRDRAALGIKSGDPAIAGNVLDAQTRLLNALQEDGYALAKVDAPIAYADDEKHVLNVTFKVDAGPQVDIGEIAFKGLDDVNESFARKALTIKPGDRYAPSKIEAARQALMAQGVFRGVTVRAADHLSADGRIPLTFDVQERKKHAVALTAAYSTDLGISLSATWSHRNLFGNAEQLNLTAAGTGLGSATTGIGYKLSAQFVKPLFLRNDQTLELDASGVKQDLDAYSQKAETVAAFLRRKFTPEWTGTIGVSFAHDNVSQEGADRLYELAAVPVTASYDSTGVADLLHDPVKGWRASFAVTPTQSFGASNLTFFVLQASASTYFDLSGDGRSVLALRGLTGSILGGTNLELPPDQRLYAGGSATVRGYAFQSIGPLFPDGNPVGAKSVDAGTVEFRQRIGEDWGGVAFIDAGQASANGAPFNGDVRVGAGVGARYYTAIGAVRLDLAVPLTRVPGGDAFEIYIGLGQAF
ncbi:MAG TPA: BamA/TamA family outer membrane protein [Rhizomicrobium sp.]|nr:BamA/TamA family outer membrane protein [Rhizomicrobium sp.]